MERMQKGGQGMQVSVLRGQKTVLPVKFHFGVGLCLSKCLGIYKPSQMKGFSAYQPLEEKSRGLCSVFMLNSTSPPAGSTTDVLRCL